MNMPEYASICLNMQGYEYARVRNMPDIVLSLRSLFKVGYLAPIEKDRYVQNLFRQLTWNCVEE